ncbi:MAG: leucine--tRNA ligase [Clostridiales bacterium]|nr:leucine--tRNA ligase [Clostridiales bacterium]
MAKDYNFREVEQKWQKYWYENKLFEVKEDPAKPKFYGLIEFPYPSGAGLHVGHIRAFSSIEVIARKKRLEGYNVLFPIGFDAFGLPTENFAMATKQHPRKVTDANIKKFVEQLKKIGYSFDWSRVVDTTDPDYYRWTQWIFLQLFKRGLAYKATTMVNFCPSCKVVLANEESQNGVCDRCGAEVIQKEKDVWFLKIREYAERLLEGLDHVDFPEKIKVEQQNWIGKSTGAEIIFKVKTSGGDYPLKVYTTRPDTIYGVTFLVISPEHPLLQEHKGDIANIGEVEAYQNQAKTKREFERIYMSKEKTGVKINGMVAVNPITGTEIPIFTADYVMMDYGTGAIMAVPGHDQRDWDFAKKFGLPIIEVISGGDVTVEAYVDKEGGTMVNSPLINGLPVKEAINKMIDYMEARGIGKRKTDYKMKDWAFNRQRYWGEPIPIINCPKCGQVPVPEEELPLRLPDLEDFSPTDDASSPLAKCKDWVNTTCPICGGPATRETDTMPQWAGSSWYFLRYMSPNCETAPVDPEAYKYWGQVDWYNGGMEHVTRHLIYSRFWNLFLYDIGVVTNPEPYKRRSAQGLILGADGEKMSKSRGNIVNPDDVVNAYGADVLRIFILFIGDYEKPAPWSPDGIKGCSRFTARLWNLQDMLVEDCDTSDLNLDALIKKVSDDYESIKFNTAIAHIMTALNTIYARGKVTRKEFNTILLLLNPVAPHITSELYEIINNGAKIEQQSFPTYDPAKLISDTVEIPVQIMGKVRGRVTVARGASQDEVLNAILGLGLLEGKSVVKVIYVPDRIINLVVK